MVTIELTFENLYQTIEDTAGIAECIKRQLILPYPVLYEKQGEYVSIHLCLRACVVYVCVYVSE